MKKENYKKPAAMTLVEMMVAISIMATIFMVLAPQLRLIQNSWAMTQAQGETLQNGRVFIEEITAALQQASQITAVSSPSENNGYIEFLGHDDITRRCQILNNNISFGEPNALAQIAGPATALNFSCFSATDLVSPITDPNLIRSVKVSATIKDPESSVTETYTTQAYLRVNSMPAQDSAGTRYIFDNNRGKTPALAKIDDSHYICAYTSYNDTGVAQILWTNSISKALGYVNHDVFEYSMAITPTLCKIDNWHYLVAYESIGDDGYAQVICINPTNYAIWHGNATAFDSTVGQQPALTQIDASRYLCVYKGSSSCGYAIVLTVDTWFDSVAKANFSPYRFDSIRCYNPDIVKIDYNRYLVVYRGEGDDGYAAVLWVNPSNWNVTKISSFEFDAQNCAFPSVVQYDSSNYICTYTGKDDDGFAVILKVNPDNTISKQASIEFDTRTGKYSCVRKIDANNFICAYQTEYNRGMTCLLNVKTNPAKIIKTGTILFEPTRCFYPKIIQSDNACFLAAYQGPSDKGYATVLSTALQVVP